MTFPRLHVITNDEVAEGTSWLTTAGEVLEAGGAAVALHVRIPHARGREVFDACAALAPVAARSGGLLLVNDRVDVAKALGLGVHLGRRSLTVTDASRVLGEASRIGVSCHEASEVASAVEEGADHVLVGHLFDTPSHPGREGLGLAGLSTAVDVAGGVPVIGIGGVTVERARSVIEAGAWGVAVVRGIWGAADSAAATVEYISALETVEEDA